MRAPYGACDGRCRRSGFQLEKKLPGARGWGVGGGSCVADGGEVSSIGSALTPLIVGHACTETVMMNRISILSLSMALSVASLSVACDDDTSAPGGGNEGGGTTTLSGGGGSGDGGSPGEGGGGAPSEGGGGSGTGGEGGGGPEGMSASASVSGDGIDGTVTFTMVGDQVTFTIEITGVTPTGYHAVHIHDNPDCSGDLSAAGGHWNPNGAASHGVFDQGGHLGDIGNIPVANDGTGTLTVTTNLWSVGAAGTDVMKNVVGHSIIVHAMDNADPGMRMACGIVTLE